MSRKTPKRRLNPEILLELARPNDLSSLGVETKKVSFGAKRVDFAVLDHGRGARSGGVTHVVRAIIFIFPKNFPIAPIQAEHSLGSLDNAPLKRVLWIGRFCRQLPIGDIDVS